MRVPPLKIKITPESNLLRCGILVPRLSVPRRNDSRTKHRARQLFQVLPDVPGHSVMRSSNNKFVPEYCIPEL